MATIAPIGKSFYYDANGNPLSGGKVYTYEAGTTTPKVTFTTQDEVTANPNPVILDADGGANIWLGDGGYKFVVTNSADVELFTADNIGGGSSAAFGSNVNTLSSNTPITDLYANSANICTSPITLSLLSASTANEGFYFSVQNNSGGDVTINPDGSELINGLSSYVFGDGTSGLVICDGVQWYVILSTGDLGSLAFLDEVPNNSITNAKLADVATATIKGRTTAGTGDPEDLTPAQARTVMDVYSTGEVDAAISAIDYTWTASSSVGTGTTFEILSSLPSTVTEIDIFFTNLSNNASADEFLLQLSDGSYVTTGYISRSVIIGATSSSESSVNGFIYSNADAGRNHNVEMNLKRISSTNEWRIKSTGEDTTNNVIICTGRVVLSSALEAVRIAQEGTAVFDNGTVIARYR